MFVREIKTSLDHIKGIGKTTLGLLAKLGLVNITDLLCYYPRDYEDRSHVVPIQDFQKGNVCTIAHVVSHKWFGFGAMKTLKVNVEDETGRAVLVCFNRPFLENKLIPNTYIRLWGHFFYKYGEIQSSAFEFEETAQGDKSLPISKNFGSILPVYRLCAGLSSGALRNFIKTALSGYAGSSEDELPENIIEKEKLMHKKDALCAIHFPSSLEELQIAKKTLIYEELFYMEIIVGKRHFAGKALRKENNNKNSNVLTNFQERLLARLPFSLTEGQLGAIKEINADIENEYPMARLLQGDVGSGKTLVSFLAAVKICEKGGQAAIMAPTELLARQHAENAAALLEPLGFHAAFLTGNIKTGGRKNLLKALEAGDIDIVLGTHALFSRDVVYKNLRLVVIDEQHRFGVTQRQAIVAKGENCNLLMMSATPIPRTLALTVFGDMDISVIRGLPLGRKPVITHLAKQSNEEKVYDFVRVHLKQGEQVYFVYPLIEADEDTGLKDAVSAAENLGKNIFPEYRCALLHSKVSDDEKKSVMEQFRKGDIAILAATSVVEVGVDVPNATCMVIEHAERFGLSALHQLRGRVGRGTAASFCFLVYGDDLKEDGKQRLKVMLENSDGFVIAEEDLKMRGPGQIIGTEQSGYLTLGIADPVRDADILLTARNDAFSLLENDPMLESESGSLVQKVLLRAPPFADV